MLKEPAGGRLFSYGCSEFIAVSSVDSSALIAVPSVYSIPSIKESRIFSIPSKHSLESSLNRRR